MGKWFTIKELCVSASYPKFIEIPEEGTSIYKNLTYTIERLDNIREKWGSPIIVTSGYRPPALNNAVGGSKTSAHVVGLAADIHPQKGDIVQLAALIASIPMDFDQLILERCSVKNNEIVGCQWLHIGFSRTNNRRQILAWDGKTYKPVKVTEEIKFSI
jgi:hypothetical protein